MEFEEKIRQLAKRVNDFRAVKKPTEEATKHALILPFIMALGYDYTDPKDVTPELVCDIGLKQGEKIDYALMIDGKPAIIMECKSFNSNLDVRNDQLLRYFVCAEAKIGVLTNGVQYQFFTNIKDTKDMEKEPFFVIDVTTVNDNQLKVLEMFRREIFKPGEVLDSAKEIRIFNSIKSELMNELTEPSDEFMKLFSTRVKFGSLAKNTTPKFRKLILGAIKHVIENLYRQFNSDEISGVNRLPDSVIPESERASKNTGNQSEFEDNDILNVVKGLVKNQEIADRITVRKLNYGFSVVLDNSNQRRILKIVEGNGTKTLITYQDNDKEVKCPIVCVQEIESVAHNILATLKRLIKA